MINKIYLNKITSLKAMCNMVIFVLEFSARQNRLTINNLRNSNEPNYPY